MSHFHVWNEVLCCDECGRRMPEREGPGRNVCGLCKVDTEEQELRRKRMANVHARVDAAAKRGTPAIILGVRPDGFCVTHNINKANMKEIATMRRNEGLPSVFRDGKWRWE